MKVLMIYRLFLCCIVFQNIIFCSQKSPQDLVVYQRTGSLQSVRRCSDIYGKALVMRVYPVNLDKIVAISSPCVKEQVEFFGVFRKETDSLPLQEYADQNWLRECQDGYQILAQKFRRLKSLPEFSQELDKAAIEKFVSSELAAIEENLYRTTPLRLQDYVRNESTLSYKAEERELCNKMSEFQRQCLCKDQFFVDIKRSYIDIKALYISLWCLVSMRAKKFLDLEMQAIEGIYGEKLDENKSKRRRISSSVSSSASLTT